MLCQSKSARCDVERGSLPCELKVRYYDVCLIGLNEYLAAFPGAKESDKVGKTELNEIVLNGMPNGLRSKSYVQGFDCKFITKQSVNMFEHMEVTEFIYEGFVKPSLQ